MNPLRILMSTNGCLIVLYVHLDPPSKIRFFVGFSLNYGVFFKWLLGFLASWLFGFSAFGLLGFWRLFGFGFSHRLHSQFLFGRWRFGVCGFSLAFAALAFRILCFPSSSPGFLAFSPFHWFLDLASRIISTTSSSQKESSLLRTSLGGASPPQPTRYCLDCLQSSCTPI